MSDLPTDLQVLLDREKIRDVLSRYNIYMDTGRFIELAGLFLPDGDWNGTIGRAAIAERLARLIPLPAEGPRRIHFLSNILIEVAGDAASVVANWVVVRESAEGAILGAAGRYEDQLLRMNGIWYFKRRRITEDISGDLGLKS